MPDGVGEVICQRRVVQHHDGVLRPGGLRHPARTRGLVVPAALEPHREGRDRPFRGGRRHAQHRGGVQAPTEETAHGHAGHHAGADGLLRQLPHPRDGIWKTGRCARRSGPRQVPVALEPHPTRSGKEHVPGRHL